MDDNTENDERKPDEPTAVQQGDLTDPAERAKDAMHKAGERARRTKRGRIRDTRRYVQGLRSAHLRFYVSQHQRSRT